MKDTVVTFLANLKHDIRNGQSVEVGSGIFSPEELRDVVEALSAPHAASEPVAYCYEKRGEVPVFTFRRWDAQGRASWLESPLFTAPQPTPALIEAARQALEWMNWFLTQDEVGSSAPSKAIDVAIALRRELEKL